MDTTVDTRTADSGHADKGADTRPADSGHADKGADTRPADSGHGRGHADMSTDKVRKLALSVAILAGAFTTLLTVASFTLSYAHLENVAVANGVPSGVLAWMWPGTIDTFTVVGELLILFAAILGLGFAWWGWGLTVGGSATSIAFNVAGVGEGAPLVQYAVAGAPPVAALFAFGALMHQVRRYVSMNVSVRPVKRTVDTVVSAVRTADKALVTFVDTMTPDHTPLPPRPMSAPPVVSVRTADSGHADTVDVWRNGAVSGVLSADVRPDTRTADTDSGHADKPADKVADTRTSARVRTDKPVDSVRAARVSAVRAALSERPDMTGRDVADMIEGITGRTGQRILAEARAAA